MPEKKAPRMCARFHCSKRGGNYCCVDCRRRPLCLESCQSDPARCGLEDMGRIAAERKEGADDA